MGSRADQETQVLLANDASFESILHRRTAGTAGVGALLRKDPEAHKEATEQLFEHWDKVDPKKDTEENRKARATDYAVIARQYYNLVTDFYEYGWGKSFHLCRFGAREPFPQAIARHEHYLAHSIGIRKGMKVLDVGCGIGGPAREIANFTGANITALNINEYQLQRAMRYTEQDGLLDQIQFVQSDFMNMPFDDNTFDAVYAIEATCYAPDLQAVYEQLFRVVKPGGIVGIYECVMTENFDESDPKQRELRFEIEKAGGMPRLVKAHEALDAWKAAGFEVLDAEDLTERPDPRPWYWPLKLDGFRHAQGLGDLMTILGTTAPAQFFLHNFLGVLEMMKMAPPGTKKTADELTTAARVMAKAGSQRLFTPMYILVGRKPMA